MSLAAVPIICKTGVLSHCQSEGLPFSFTPLGSNVEPYFYLATAGNRQELKTWHTIFKSSRYCDMEMKYGVLDFGIMNRLENGHDSTRVLL